MLARDGDFVRRGYSPDLDNARTLRMTRGGSSPTCGLVTETAGIRT
jgi:hypothetical protein